MIFAITFWQWIWELIISAVMIGLQYYSTGNRFVEHLMLLFVAFLSYVVFPSFFVISDSNFRRAVEENAIIKFVQRTYMYGMIFFKCIQL